MIEVSLATTDAALHSLRTEWGESWARAPGPSPFQHPDWLLPWWWQFGTGQPRVACARAGGLLAGLLPIGAGTSDQLGALTEAGVPLDALLHPLLAREAHPCELIEVPPGGALRGPSAPSGWAAAWRDDSPCPVVALPGTRGTLADAVPHSMLRTLRLNRNRARRAGGVRVETATAAALSRLMAELARLHQARWTGSGEHGAFANPHVAAHLDGMVATAMLALLTPGRILFTSAASTPSAALSAPAAFWSAPCWRRRCARGGARLASCAAARRINTLGAASTAITAPAAWSVHDRPTRAVPDGGAVARDRPHPAHAGGAEAGRDRRPHGRAA